MAEDRLRGEFGKAYDRFAASAAIRDAPMLGHDGAVALRAITGSTKSGRPVSEG